MEIVRNFFDNAARIVTDSKYGLGALHTVPPWLVKNTLYYGLETRLGQTAISMGSALLLANQGTTDKTNVQEELCFGKLITRFGTVALAQYLWRTRLFLKPLDCALTQTIAASSLVTALDSMAFTAMLVSLKVKDPKNKATNFQSLIALSWIGLRLADIWKGENQIAFRLMHFDTKPLQLLDARLEAWLTTK